MKDKLLSVIIPTYNMEKLLRRCLASLIVSEENRPLLEVLVINDGSTDASSVIGHEYVSQYPEIFRVIDKENGNYGSCVNRGLKEMTGKYVRILDADDYYQTEQLDQFITQLKDTDTDLVLSDMLSVYADGKQVHLSASPDDLMDQVEMHMVTYKKDVLDKVAYRQTEGISYTDQEWTLYPMMGVNTISRIPLDIYVYMLDREGQTMDLDVEVKNVSHKIVIANRMIDFVKCATFEDSSKETYAKHRLWRFLRLIYKLVLLYQTEDQYCSYIGELQALDDKVRNDLADLYEETNAFVISKEVPLKFVRYWRENHRRYPHVILLFNQQLKRLDVFLRKIHLRG